MYEPLRRPTAEDQSPASAAGASSKRPKLDKVLELPKQTTSELSPADTSVTDIAPAMVIAEEDSVASFFEAPASLDPTSVSAISGDAGDALSLRGLQGRLRVQASVEGSLDRPLRPTLAYSALVPKAGHNDNYSLIFNNPIDDKVNEHTKR